jgi:hypothetical protein
MPQLVALHKRNADKGLAVVGLHVQNAEDDEIKEVVKKLKIKFPVTKGGSGPSKGNGIPHTLVFDVEGKLAFEGHPADKDFKKAVDKSLKAVTASAPSSGLGPKPGATPSTSPSTKPAKPAVLIAERAWTNTDGKTMTAALVSVDGDNAKFKKKDGSTFNYPLSKLTEEDQATIKEAAEKAKEPAPGTP